jgi:type VI secretion system protein ImpM
MNTGAPGWHGKLPSLGDFASRRLPHEFVEVWDGWLAAGLSALREAGPDQWLDGYLASPIWRFLIMPGALSGSSGQQGWTGVLMPSVDRAGRYFPFTVAWPLARLPGSAEGFTALHRWLRQLDDLAADALQDDWTVPQLEAELERLHPPALGDARPVRSTTALAPGNVSAAFTIDSAADVTSLITEDALGIWQTAASGQALWWCEPGADPGRLVVTRGLPAGKHIGMLFGAAEAGLDGTAATPNTSTASGSG